MSHQCALATKNPNDILGCVRQNIASRLRDGILPLCSVLVRPPLGCWDQCWAPQDKRDVDRLERVQGGATRMLKDWSISAVGKG